MPGSGRRMKLSSLGSGGAIKGPYKTDLITLLPNQGPGIAFYEDSHGKVHHGTVMGGILKNTQL